MTKKDYKLIATAIRDASFTCDPGTTATVAHVARMVAENLAKENPRFDQSKFLVACGF